ncbi:hypothetical protein GobsT_04270 [Gemmata obscuriglobus]|uniref:Uncharacterized protein n=1 Tax=Gemmata obscuriglobus TaxID=114 RepID=A0A2Z3H965_9BACT|nr:hypothetical protein [Gemmata obscuriglobus]AWM40982.1 hypothetical protein C1280_31035 [Gemmata obscuriglobus]QEG25700.1 hypothetical protein GobsT_04270 [Gemmata obscuriglobus]VTR99378.1 unnamed protein product [Gemmata obscuriglobus UQM 2246]
MTLTPADLDLSPPAAARLEEYLGQVRGALAGAPDVSAGDIESDLREHVANELSAAPKPVALAALSAVLEQLGPPAQWGAAPDPAAFHGVRHLLREHLRGARTAAAAGARRVRLTLWSGPEDWRLAYLSFGVLAVGLVTMVVFPLALLLSYLLSRAGIAHARERGIDLGAGRKWLLYPPVVLVSATLLLAAVMWPVALGLVAGAQVEQAQWRLAQSYEPHALPSLEELRAPPSDRWLTSASRQQKEDRKLLMMIPVAPDLAQIAAGLFAGAGAAAFWWMVLGAAGANFPGAVRATFFPLCNRFEPHHGTWLAVVCFLLLLPWLAAAREFVAALL